MDSAISYSDFIIMEAIDSCLSLQVSVDGDDSSAGIDDEEGGGDSETGASERLHSNNLHDGVRYSSIGPLKASAP